MFVILFIKLAQTTMTTCSQAKNGVYIYIYIYIFVFFVCGFPIEKNNMRGWVGGGGGGEVALGPKENGHRCVTSIVQYNSAAIQPVPSTGRGSVVCFGVSLSPVTRRSSYAKIPIFAPASAVHYICNATPKTIRGGSHRRCRRATYLVFFFEKQKRNKQKKET